MVWEWYKWRINLVLDSHHNLAHRTLADLEKRGYNIIIITQNVDDLHERAGSTNVIHVHGQILKFRCLKCGKTHFWTKNKIQASETVPKCNDCNFICRPDVVWFGESLNSGIMKSCIDRLMTTDVLIIAGTSGVVYPVSEFPYLAKQQNPHLGIYEFNIEFTPISNIVTNTILGPVEETLVEFSEKINFL